MSTLQEKSVCINEVSSANNSQYACDLEKQETHSDSFGAFSVNSDISCVKEDEHFLRNSAVFQVAADNYDPGSVTADASVITNELRNYGGAHHTNLIKRIPHPLPSEHIKLESFQQFPADFKIDIKEENLQPPVDEKKSRTSKKVLFRQLIKSLSVLCDICDDSRTERAIKLNKRERLVGAIVLKKSLSLGLKPKKILQKRIPEQSCGYCFIRIVLLTSRLKEKFQEIKVKKEPSMNPPHGYNCLCPYCRNHYRGLGLLIKGIETLDPESQMDQQTLETHSRLNSEESKVFEQQQSFQIHELQLVGQHFPTAHSSTQIIGQAPREVAQLPLSYGMSHTQDCSNNNSEIRIMQPPYSVEQENQRSFLTFSGYPSSYSPSFAGPSYMGESYTTSPYQSDQSEQQSTGGNYSGYSRSHQSEIPTDSNARDSTLPTILQEFEDKNQIDLNQPTTSSQYPGQRLVTDEEQASSRKTTKVCIHCQKQFNHTGDYRKHLRKHTKEKPYSCSQCDKRFSHTSNLHRHERSHTGARPFKCEFCNKEFNRKDKLDSHKKSKSCRNRRYEGRK